MNFESKEYTCIYKNENSQGVEVYWAKLVNFGQLGHISSLQVNFLKSWGGFNDHKEPENIKKLVHC